jgi:hypothetical protein
MIIGAFPVAELGFTEVRFPAMDEENTRVSLPVRLGNVVYWVAFTAAIGCIFLGALGFVIQLFHLIQDEPSMADNIFMFASGVCLWILARAVKFALAGRQVKGL